MSAQLSRCVAVYSRHFVASRIDAPVAVVFTLDHIVTTQTTMGWTESLHYHTHTHTHTHADCHTDHVTSRRSPSINRKFTVLQIRYDTIRDAILTCARKPTWIGLIYRTETTTKNCKTEKLKSKSRYVRINSKSLGNHVVHSEKRKRKAAVGRICRKRF